MAESNQYSEDEDSEEDNQSNGEDRSSKIQIDNDNVDEDSSSDLLDGQKSESEDEEDNEEEIALIDNLIRKTILHEKHEAENIEELVDKTLYIHKSMIRKAKHSKIECETDIVEDGNVEKVTLFKFFPISLHTKRGGKLGEDLVHALVEHSLFCWNDESDHKSADLFDKKERVNGITTALRLENKFIRLTSNLELCDSSDSDIVWVFIDNLPNYFTDKNLRASIEKSEFISLYDYGYFTKTGQKYIFLLTPLFKAKHSNVINDDENFLCSLIQKWFSHEYVVTSTSHSSAQEMEEHFKLFFAHYSNHESYTVTQTKEFSDQLSEFESFVFNELWPAKECEFYFLGLETTFSESKFGLRLQFLPKHIFVKNSWDVKCRLVDIHWDMKHISASAKMCYSDEKGYRKKSLIRILMSIINSYRKSTWSKSRKRDNGNFDNPQPNVTFVQSNIQFP